MHDQLYANLTVDSWFFAHDQESSYLEEGVDQFRACTAWAGAVLPPTSFPIVQHFTTIKVDLLILGLTVLPSEAPIKE